MRQSELLQQARIGHNSQIILESVFQSKVLVYQISPREMSQIYVGKIIGHVEPIELHANEERNKHVRKIVCIAD